MISAYFIFCAVIFCSLNAPREACAFAAVPLDPLTSADPSLTGGLAGAAWLKSNPAWDGSRARISGGKGEHGALQIVILPESGETLEDLRPSLRVSGIHVLGVWRAWRIWNAFEVAVPLAPSGPRMDVPSDIPLERASEREDRVKLWSLWIEYEIATDADPGEHSGELRVETTRGAVVIPILAVIHPFDLPAVPSFTVEMNSYGDYARLLGGDSETYLGLQRLFRRFGCIFTQVPYLQSGDIPQSFLAPTVGSSDGDALLDWRAFDEALSGLFDGSAFSDGEPISHFLLPLSFDWPMNGSLRAASPEAYRRVNIRARREIAAHIREKGWTRTAFLEFHNENPEHGSAAPWRLDEPRAAEDIQGHAYFQDFLNESRKKGTAGAGPLYRVDISDWRTLGKGLETLGRGADIWSVSEDEAFLSADSAQFFKKAAASRSGFALAYGELPGFLRNGVRTNLSSIAAPLLRARTFGLDGYAQWMVDHWKDKDLGPGVPPQAVPLFYSSASGARDLIWPGQWLNAEGLLPSLRLFAVRETLNLLDYATLALAQGALDEKRLIEELGNLDLASSTGFYALKDRLAASVARELE